MRTLSIFLYSLPFPAVWICGSFIISSLPHIPGLGLVRTALICIVAALLICWLFVRQRRREFSKSEFWAVILFSTGWSLLMDFGLLWHTMIRSHHPTRMPVSELVFVGLLTGIVTGLFMWLSFLIVGKRFIRSYLAKTNL